MAYLKLWTLLPVPLYASFRVHLNLCSFLICSVIRGSTVCLYLKLNFTVRRRRPRTGGGLLYRSLLPSSFWAIHVSSDSGTFARDCVPDQAWIWDNLWWPTAVWTPFVRKGKESLHPQQKRHRKSYKDSGRDLKFSCSSSLIKTFTGE